MSSSDFSKKCALDPIGTFKEIISKDLKDFEDLIHTDEIVAQLPDADLVEELFDDALNFKSFVQNQRPLADILVFDKNNRQYLSDAEVVNWLIKKPEIIDKLNKVIEDELTKNPSSETLKRLKSHAKSLLAVKVFKETENNGGFKEELKSQVQLAEQAQDSILLDRYQNLLDQVNGNQQMTSLSSSNQEVSVKDVKDEIQNILKELNASNENSGLMSRLVSVFRASSSASNDLSDKMVKLLNQTSGEQTVLHALIKDEPALVVEVVKVLGVNVHQLNWPTISGDIKTMEPDTLKLVLVNPCVGTSNFQHNYLSNFAQTHQQISSEVAQTIKEDTVFCKTLETIKSDLDWSDFSKINITLANQRGSIEYGSVEECEKSDELENKNEQKQVLSSAKSSKKTINQHAQFDFKPLPAGDFREIPMQDQPKVSPTPSRASTESSSDSDTSSPISCSDNSY
jgi:hypothetical protein